LRRKGLTLCTAPYWELNRLGAEVQPSTEAYLPNTAPLFHSQVLEDTRIGH
jgi:hypothetical protein